MSGLLASCCAQVAAAREALHGLGAARKLLPLLSSGNEEVQEGGAMAVQQLSLLPAAAREVRLHGGVPLLVELMASLDARVQVRPTTPLVRPATPLVRPTTPLVRPTTPSVRPTTP